jgi:hypothetical protein
MGKRITPGGLVEWLASGSRGISSNTIVQHLTGWPAAQDWYPDIPQDPGDLDRCLRLLAEVPLLRVMLPDMRTCSPMWNTLMDHWDEIEACHLEEVGLGWTKAKSAPKTYQLMRSVIDSARKKDTQP